MSHYIHNIIYINLDKRYDRRVQIENELNHMKLSYERFSAISHKHAFIGCAYSHLAVLKLAKQRGYKNILILEDDFTFLVSKEEFERQINEVFRVIPDYDVFMLSYNLNESQDVNIQYSEFKWKRVLYAQTASGYLVNSEYYDKLIELYEWAFPLLEQTHQHWIYMNDVVWKTLQQKDAWYCIEPRIGKQRESYSDLAGEMVNYGL